MYNLKRIFAIYFLFLKRNMKKKSFCLIMLILPLFLYLFTGLGFDNGEILRVGIYGYDNSFAESFYKELSADSDIVDYYLVQSAESINSELDKGRADAVIIIDTDLYTGAKEYINNAESFIKVRERQSSVVSNLIREKIYSKVFPEIAYAVYEKNIDKILESNAEIKVSGEKQKSYFDDINIDSDIIKLESLQGKKNSGINKERVLFANIFYGIIGIWLYICAFLGLLNYCRDREGGLFVRVNVGDFILPGYIINFITIPTIIAAFSDYIVRKEANILNILLMSLCITCFVYLIGAVTKNTYLISSIFCISIPIMFIINPVFINLDFGKAECIKSFSPIYFYMRSAEILKSVVYIIIMLLFSIGIEKVRKSID